MDDIIEEMLPKAQQIARRYSQDDELESYVVCKLVDVVRRAFDKGLTEPDEVRAFAYQGLRFYAKRYLQKLIRAQHKPLPHKPIVFPDLLELGETVSACARSTLDYQIITMRMEGYTDKEIAEETGISRPSIHRYRQVICDRYLESSQGFH